MWKIRLAAIKYATKIFELEPGYSLHKAKRIFGKYYYLVQDHYNSLQTAKEISEVTRNALFIKTISAIKQLGGALMEFNQAKTPKAQIEGAKKVLEATTDVIASFIEEGGYGTLENLMNDPEYLRFKTALEAMNESAKQLGDDLHTIKDIKDSLTNDKEK